MNTNNKLTLRPSCTIQEPFLDSVDQDMSAQTNVLSDLGFALSAEKIFPMENNFWIIIFFFVFSFSFWAFQSTYIVC